MQRCKKGHQKEERACARFIAERAGLRILAERRLRKVQAGVALHAVVAAVALAAGGGGGEGEPSRGHEVLLRATCWISGRFITSSSPESSGRAAVPPHQPGKVFQVAAGVPSQWLLGQCVPRLKHVWNVHTYGD